MSKLATIQLDDETIQTIMDMSACNFAPGQIALALGVKKSLFLSFFNEKGSEIRDAYDAGKLDSVKEIMSKQLELGKGGNITAAQIFLKESERIEFENIKRKTFFGDEA